MHEKCLFAQEHIYPKLSLKSSKSSKRKFGSK